MKLSEALKVLEEEENLIPKELEPLAKEAKKYKNVDEFLKRFHWGTKINNDPDRIKIIQKWNKLRKKYPNLDTEWENIPEAVDFMEEIKENFSKLLKQYKEDYDKFRLDKLGIYIEGSGYGKKIDEKKVLQNFYKLATKGVKKIKF